MTAQQKQKPTETKADCLTRIQNERAQFIEQSRQLQNQVKALQLAQVQLQETEVSIARCEGILSALGAEFADEQGLVKATPTMPEIVQTKNDAQKK